MRQVVVLTEEDSARIVAEKVAINLGIEHVTRVIQHEGSSDLEKSIPRKIGFWRSEEPPRFVILRDNDGRDCLKLKQRLWKLVPEHAVNRVKIRIVIHELESWYLGDLHAMAMAGLISEDQAVIFGRKAKLRNIDRLTNAKQEFLRIVPSRGQVELAKLIGPNLNKDRCRAQSFKTFVESLIWASS
jgi:hypothetical protein